MHNPWYRTQDIGFRERPVHVRTSLPELRAPLLRSHHHDTGHQMFQLTGKIDLLFRTESLTEDARFSVYQLISISSSSVSFSIAP